MRLLGYIRVSRVGGRSGEGYISPSVQRAAIENYAAELQGSVVEWFTDEDETGGTTDRPAFQAALAMLEAGDADGLVVMKIDRFARSVPDGTRIVREIVDRGQVFASCHERIDPRTPEGRFMLTSFLANGELFLDQVKAGWKVAKARAVARGVHIGPTPIGYRREKSQPLAVDPHYGPAMTELFARAATRQFGDSMLARWMDNRAPRANGTPWRASEIRRWLRNRLYLGEVHYGELVNTEAHPALTDRETWERCQRAPGVRNTAATPFLLRGFLRCAHCRYAMGGQTYGGNKGETPVYRCTNTCGEPSVIVASRIENYVVSIISGYVEGLRLIGVDAGRDLRAVDQAWQEADDEVRAFASDLEARRLLGEDVWRETLALRVADRDRKAATRADAYEQASLAELVEDVGSLDRHDLRDLLGAFVQAVFVRRRRGAPVEERALIVWKSDASVDVPGPHRSGPYEPIRW